MTTSRPALWTGPGRDPAIAHVETSAFLGKLPDVEASIEGDYFTLRFTVEGSQQVELTLFLPHSTDAERLGDRTVNAIRDAQPTRVNRVSPRPARQRPRRPNRRRA